MENLKNVRSFTGNRTKRKIDTNELLKFESKDEEKALYVDTKKKKCYVGFYNENYITVMQDYWAGKWLMDNGYRVYELPQYLATHYNAWIKVDVDIKLYEVHAIERIAEDYPYKIIWKEDILQRTIHVIPLVKKALLNAYRNEIFHAEKINGKYVVFIKSGDEFINLNITYFDYYFQGPHVNRGDFFDIMHILGKHFLSNWERCYMKGSYVSSLKFVGGQNGK